MRAKSSKQRYPALCLSDAVNLCVYMPDIQQRHCKNRLYDSYEISWLLSNSKIQAFTFCKCCPAIRHKIN